MTQELAGPGATLTRSNWLLYHCTLINARAPSDGPLASAGLPGLPFGIGQARHVALLSANADAGGVADMRWLQGSLAFGVAVCGWLANRGGAAPVCQPEQKLLADDFGPGRQFGRSISVFGDTAFIGAYGDSNHGTYAGAAYVFRDLGSGWHQVQKLHPSDSSEEERFGFSVSLTGDTAIVGAPARFGPESAYVFRLDGSAWMESQKLTASDPKDRASFGYSVSISGEHAIVGVPFDDDMGAESGAAYAFRFNGSTWVEVQKLISSDAAEHDWFGGSVSVSGETVLVGAVHPYEDGRHTGAVYVFRFDGSSWAEEQKLTASDATYGESFGESVSVSGDMAIVGAPSDDDHGADSGSAYLFRFDGSMWAQEQKLLASDGGVGDGFASSVATSGNIALVGAPYHSPDDNLYAGAAYIFRFNSSAWVEERKLLASDAGSGDQFGVSVVVSGGSAFIGAPLNDDNGVWAGAEYVYCVAEGACCDHSPAEGGLCRDTVFVNCPIGSEVTWTTGGFCDEIGCEEDRGACCDTLNGACIPDLFIADCQGSQRVWTQGATCDEVPCDAVAGACCDQDTFGGCTRTTNAKCACPLCVWNKLLTCADIECSHNPIPTVSEWGLVVMALLLLTGAKVYFGRRSEMGSP